jgi:hypothetical protein
MNCSILQCKDGSRREIVQASIASLSAHFYEQSRSTLVLFISNPIVLCAFSNNRRHIVNGYFFTFSSRVHVNLRLVACVDVTCSSSVCVGLCSSSPSHFFIRTCRPSEFDNRFSFGACYVYC